jgi:hypothetical protein
MNAKESSWRILSLFCSYHLFIILRFVTEENMFVRVGQFSIDGRLLEGCLYRKSISIPA